MFTFKSYLHWQRVCLRLLPALALSLGVLVSHGQSSEAAIIVGQVADTDHRVLSAAAVVLHHLATNTVTRVVTDGSGEYRTPPLRLGEYSLEVTAEGFKRAERNGIKLSIGDVRKINVELAVGNVSETVSVDADVALLQTEDSSVGVVITNKQINDLPLNGRDYLQLAALSSGTAPAVAGAPGGAVGVSIGGQNGSQASYQLDGADNNSQQMSVGHTGRKEVIKPSVDAIEEFKVVTNSYSAEYGRSSSGVISVALKSGSNSLHGSAFEFLRNEYTDAANRFATERAPYKRNQYGGSLGGPIVKDKLFYFSDAEFSNVRQANTETSTLPSSAQRNGIFSSTIKDPTTSKAFADNTIPESRWDPVAVKILSYIPAAQTTATSSNYVYNSPANQDPYRWDLRVDQNISPKQRAYLRYSQEYDNTGVDSQFPRNAAGYVGGAGAQATKARSFVLVHNKVWSDRLITSLHIGWNYLDWVNNFPKQSLSDVGIPGVSTANPGFSNIKITGYQSTSSASTTQTGWGVTNVPNHDQTQDRQLSGDVTRTEGAHTLKVGVQANWLQTNFLSSQRSQGIFNFNGQFTGNGFADYLLGYVSSSSLSTWSVLNFRSAYTHFFVQDDWRISRALTVNYGLRYELSPAPVDKFDRIANFDLDTDPSSPKLVQAGSEGDDHDSRALQNTNYFQFAPRIGIAYNFPRGNTVVRIGYGIFYSNFITWGGQSSMEVNPPNALRVNFSSSKTKPQLNLQDGFSSTALTLANAKNVTLISYERRNVTPTAQQYNLNIQHQFPGGVLLEVGYFGDKYDHAWWVVDGNPAAAKAGTVNANRKFSSTTIDGTAISLADVVRIRKDGTSRYNSLQVRAEKRYSNGLSALASYSFSKTIALGDTSSNSVQNPDNLKAERAVSTQNVPHILTGSLVYALPFGRGKSWGSQWGSVTNNVFGGWSAASILSLCSGTPLNVTVASQPSNTGQIDRPNIVGKWKVAHPSASEWFNQDAFEAADLYTFGNAPRNLVQGPGLKNLDLALYKTFRLSERLTSQLRAESFNFTNTPALGNPDTILGDAAFGTITTAGEPRHIQLGLKFLF